MTQRQLLKETAAHLQSLGILTCDAQTLGFLKAWQDEDPEVIECLANCISKHPDWLYGWLLSGETPERTNFTWLRFLIVENKPMMAVDNFCFFMNMAFALHESICGPV
jgi:hypothetical protein